MKVEAFLVAALVVFTNFSQIARGQKAEASINYSFMIYNPAKNLAGSRNLNGGGGSIGKNFGEYLTLKGEFEAYTTSTLTFHYATTPGATPTNFTTQANLFTYLFGPQLNWTSHRRRIFGEALFGGAHTKGYADFFKAAGITSVSASIDGFAMAIGGGFDIPLNRHLAIQPAQLDYLMTRYEWKQIGINNQSNFRYQAGVLFAFGY
jgi:hypothetical protein